MLRISFVVFIQEAYSKSYGRIVHGELPQGFSPWKLTVPPWKASDFPNLQTLPTVTETVSLEIEYPSKGNLTVKLTLGLAEPKVKV
ncbi:hypothetical protein SAMN05421743_109193 [Thalassobacillus cyri]|uniref:Uncharacterized protein n=1 Tax=Thalassobacillus cyri TaxID=571932 RepID=A0A1H4ES43_9BACI|nr:hypothetical protein SAMN05421743_109193 [Thalassobacillus cyri]